MPNQVITPVSVFRYSLPLMLGMLGTSSLLFLDRMMLSFYSTDAMNAVSYASSVLMIAQVVLVTVCSNSEVIIGHFFAKNQHNKMGLVIWQCFWILCFFSPLFIFITTILSTWLIKDLLASQYVQLLVYFIWMPSLSASLGGFYNGQNQSRFFLFSTVVANIVNLILDWVLIFGWEPYIEPMGVKGAAIATIIGYTVQLICLIIPFFGSRRNQVCHTRAATCDFLIVQKLLFLGISPALGQLVEFGTWMLLFSFSARLGKTHMTLLSYTQSFAFLYMFILAGMSKGITILSSQCIAKSKFDQVRQILKSSIFIHYIMIASLLALLILIKILIANFFQENSFPGLAIFGAIVYLLFESVRFSYASVLLAGGDPSFIFIASFVGSCLFLLLPMYCCILFSFRIPEYGLLVLITLYVASIALTLRLRIQKGFWEKSIVY